ncbi:anti-phage protein KwaA [Nitrosovibrio tenuis]|uniref:Uncharacterized protein n=1 Tax=Nitrosovibrio tenuis TaxID=1233 RepID=A0A1H7KQL9_9PROT|nr:anti-phage protein KwaA [Nitrosovibrio tenuis]SEK88806.1 hypothetical protein SAMN05216387_103301 [Nitrosovibrio tenuis]
MHKGGLGGKIELYIVSLWFLFFLIIVITIDIPIYLEPDWEFLNLEDVIRKNIIPIVAFAFVTAGLFFYLRFEYRISGSQRIPARITKIQDVNYEHLTFLTTYIIPLICFNLSSTRYVLALGLLLVVIGVIYVKTDKFYANPTLAMLGYQIYKVDMHTRTNNVENLILISKDKLSMNDLVNYKELDEKVSFAGKVRE